jgi:hypothetical protein
MSGNRVLVGAATLWIAATFAAHAAQPKPQEAAYRCTDGSGRTHMSDSMPPECIGRDVEVLNERGRVLRVIEGEATRAARLEREAREDAERVAREEQAELDRVLLDTYQSVEEIERLRDQRLDLLASQITVAEQNIQTLRERQERLATQIQRFRPYSDAPDARPLPDHLAEEIVNTVESLRIYREQIAEKEAEQEELRQRFARDAARFRELKANR